jgi:hypothetical protein
MGDFIKEHFDKLLLAFFLLFYSGLGWHSVFYLAHHDGTIAGNPLIQGFLSAMLDNQKLVIGALLGLITGRALEKAYGGANATTTSSTTTTDTTSGH